MPRRKREGITDITGVDGMGGWMGWVGGGEAENLFCEPGEGRGIGKKQRTEKKLYEVRREFGQDSKRQTVKRNETWLRHIKQEDRE